MSLVYGTRGEPVLVLRRIYNRDGAPGMISFQGEAVCFSLELPWRFNRPFISCIPQGMYKLRLRTRKGQAVIDVLDVPGRSHIVMHPANDAQTELQGCIAPVSALGSAHTGTDSRKAMAKLVTLIRKVDPEQRGVWLFVTGTPRKRFVPMQKEDADDD